MTRITVALLAGLVIGAISPTASNAAQITLLAAGALRQVLGGLVPQFEKETGHHVDATFGPVGALTDRVAKGEAADVVIVSDAQIDQLQKLGKIVAGTRHDVARVGVGAFVRKGSPKPDIGSVDSFKRTMLAANTIAYSDPVAGGAAGIYMTSLIDRLGLSAETHQKIKLDPRGGARLYQMVANGEADLGFDQVSIIVAQPTVEFVGPLPAPIQYYTAFAAGVGQSSDQAEAAKALIVFLASPSAQAQIKAGGFEVSSN